MTAMWRWFDGKKTVLAALFWTAKETIVPIWYDGAVDPVVAKALTTVGVLLTVAGLGHKVVKQRLGGN